MSRKKSTTLRVVEQGESPAQFLWNHFHAIATLNTYALTHLEFRVAIVLLQHANGSAECFPGYVRLMRYCQCSKRGLEVALKALEDKHAIAINHGKKQRRVNRYVLTFALK